MEYAYLIKANKLYKIGKSKNPEQRVKQLKTANPEVRLIAYGSGTTEKELHRLFNANKIIGEWFKLSTNEVEKVIRLLDNTYKMEFKTTKTQQKKLNYTIKFGKYKGFKISDLTTNEELKYLVWCLDNFSNLNKYTRNMFKWWLNQIGHEYKPKRKHKKKKHKKK